MRDGARPGGPLASSLEGQSKWRVLIDWESPGCQMLLPVVEGRATAVVSGRIQSPFHAEIEWKEPQGGKLNLGGELELGFRGASTRVKKGRSRCAHDAYHSKAYGLLCDAAVVGWYMCNAQLC